MPRQCDFGSSSWQQRKSVGTAFHFFKVILEHSFQEKKLELPLKFVRKYRDELSGVAILTVADGLVWQVGLTKTSGGICFREDWDEFAKHYSLDYGHFLTFTYKGDSMFKVRIFDTSACEIVYPRVEPVKDEFSADIEDEDDPSTLIAHRQYHRTQSKVSEGSRKALDAAKTMKPKNPSFIIVIKPCDFHRKALHVPALFAREHLSGKPNSMKVVTASGREWILKTLNMKAGVVLLSGGCSQFIWDNKLKEGDVCVFELLKKNVSMQVTVFRASLK